MKTTGVHDVTISSCYNTECAPRNSFLRTAEPQNCRTAELQNCRTAELLSPPRRAVLHQVIRKQGIKVNRCVPALIDAM
jgi:hypothetical protein